MKKLVKQVLCYLLVLAMCVSLFAACGSNGGDSSSSKTEGSSSETSSAQNEDGGDESSEAEDGNTATGDKIDPTACEETMDVSIAIMTGFTQTESRVEKMLEEKYNVNIELVVLPGWSDAPSQINLMMASDDTPNMMWWWSMDNEFLQWKDAGKLDRKSVV